MSNFVNTVDVVGDEVLTDSIIDRSITEIADDTVTSIGDNAFCGCGSLTSVDFPNAETIGTESFSGCASLTTVNFPVATKIGSNAFNGCTSLTAVKFPAVTSIVNNGFQGCSALVTADFPAATNLASGAFNNCYALTALILRNESTVCTMATTSALQSTPILGGTGYVYVPRALVDTYKAATNWSTVGAQIRALEDYTVDGTTTGALDPTKI